jgi:hypothetical protein
MSQRITVTIDKVGRPKIEGHGFVGTACETKMKPIIDAVSSPDGTVEIEAKAELYMQETETAYEHN